MIPHTHPLWGDPDVHWRGRKVLVTLIGQDRPFAAKVVGSDGDWLLIERIYLYGLDEQRGAPATVNMKVVAMIEVDE